MTKIKPPAELSPRVVPLSDPRVDLTARRRGDIQAAVIHWRDLVLATWQLPADRQYTGTLPDGMTVYRFSAKVGQAAKRLAAARHVHTDACYSRVPETEGTGEYLNCGKTLESPGPYAGGRVGVAVRGRRWWVWTVARPSDKDGGLT